MPEPLSPLEANLEADIARLAVEVKNQRERPEMKNVQEAELLKEAIRAFPQLEKNPQAVAVPTPPPVSSANDDVFKNPLPAYAKDAPAEVKLEIEYLLEVAFKDGLGKALSEAQKSPYFVQDALHDALAGKLYPELQKRGIVK